MNSSIFQTPLLQEPLNINNNNNNNTFFMPDGSSNKMTATDLAVDEDKDNLNLNSIWTTDNFLTSVSSNKPNINSSNNKTDLKLDLKVTKTSWSNNNGESVPAKCDENDKDSNGKGRIEGNDSPSHHARRPMNAFLIFCKKHRPVVREKFPALENRGVTRILGEWWAQLDASDKEPYTTLAKEYKDAFLSANPNFKWYKLPAPPLRTLYQRPTSLISSKNVSPLSPVGNNNNNNNKPASPTQDAEFNPGKLADESQLGSLTSLLNMNGFSNNNNNNNSSTNNFNKCSNSVDDKDANINNNNNEVLVQDPSLSTPMVSSVDNNDMPSLPPKPIKKRINDLYNNDNNKAVAVARNIFETAAVTVINDDKDISSEENSAVTEHHSENHDRDQEDNLSNSNHDDSDNMTQQELMNKVVDSMFTESMDAALFDRKETRKSGRSCKGKRYAKFMVEGKLLGNKREKLTQQRNTSIDLNQKFETELSKLELNSSTNNNNKPETPKLDLGNTIKRLAERTHVKIDDTNDDSNNTDHHHHQRDVLPNNREEERIRRSSENSDDLSAKGDFNLDEKISNLPSLSYDTYMQRKRESKKRKAHSKTDNNAVKVATERKIEMIGSKKRKNKHSITHLDPITKSVANDLSGLATLAEVAANTERIN